MAEILASGKRLSLMLFSILTLGQATVTSPVFRWGASWWINRSSIVMLAGVNTAITTISEYASRELLASHNKKPEQRFFVVRADGERIVHRQSLTNIFMTAIASLLGGPVYFIRRRWHRFMFFTSFGAMNSATSQMLSHLVSDGYLYLTLGRFVFDLGYNASFKFFMFEFARPAILRLRKSVAGVGLVRVLQDFLTTLARVGMLNSFGFK